MFTKKCYKCKKIKELFEFAKDKSRKDGLQLSCKKCHSEYREKNKEKIAVQKAIYAKKNVKKIAQNNANYYQKNKKEILSNVKEYRENNREQIAIRKKLVYERDRVKIAEYQSEYQKGHRKEANERQLVYQKNNPGKINANTAKRRAARRQATLKDLTSEQNRQIRDIYIEAARLTKKTGIKNDVDHIIPLQGENVSGLHVPWNLQILTEFENSQKNNSFDFTYENNSWRHK